jgi:hypothetical protein
MSQMKFLPLVLLLSLAVPACHSPNARNERAYYKYLKQTNAARGYRPTRVIKQERAPMPATRPAPTPPPTEQETKQPPENQ